MHLEPIYQTIGMNIRARRRARDISQAQLAREIDVSRATLANMESGRQRIFAHQLQALAEALACAVEQLMPTPPKSDPSRPKLVFDGSLSAQQKSQLSQLIDAVPLPGAAGTTSKSDPSADSRKSRTRQARS